MKKNNISIEDEERFINSLGDFLGKEGLSALEDNFYLNWGSFLYGNIGMQVRNYISNNFPDIRHEFEAYSDFEDWTATYIQNKVLK